MIRFIFTPLFIVSCALPASAQTVVRRVEFSQNTFNAPPSREFETPVLIRPKPPAGLFSYGVVCNVQGNNGVAGIVILAPAAALSFDGVLGTGPRGIIAETGKYSVKGSVDVFSAAKAAHSGETLGTLTIAGLPSGNYTLSLASYNTLGPSESVFVDGNCRSLDSSLEFGSATLQVSSVVTGTIAALGAMTPDRQTGLLIQKYEVKNTGNVATTFRIYITNMPTGSTVWNRHGTEGGKAYIDLPAPLAPGGTMQITIEYRSTDRTTIPKPKFQLVAAPAGPADPKGSAVPITPRITLTNGNVLLEFDSKNGYSYYIQYMGDSTVWKTALPKVAGTGNRIQWIDNGPPKTASHPSTARSRFYRILAVKQ
jgi:hypothetical protein